MSTTPPPPPPPEDPFPSFSSGESPDPFAVGESEPLDQGRPNVATSPGRVKLVMGVIGAVLLFLLYNIFSGGDDKKPVEQKPVEATVAPPSVTPPPLPPMEESLPEPPPSIIPPSIPEPTDVNALIRPEDDAAQKERIKERMRSGMMVTNNAGGSGGLGLLGGSENEEQASTDPNLTFASGVSKANTKANRVNATRIGNLHRTIAQGRMIQATMESVINTELPAPVRAIVSRDVYPEAGKEPLIPKGSRLIGTYNTALLGGQSRAYLVWTRVIRPDGVDVMIDSPLVDALGQAGIGGQVDSKFQQIFSRAVMSSVIAIALAIGSDEITGGGTTSQTNSAIGGTTQSGDGATTATVNALNRLGSTTDSFMQRYLNLQPSILVDQGTKVNVFVNRDLVFPSNALGTRVIE